MVGTTVEFPQVLELKSGKFEDFEGEAKLLSVNARSGVPVAQYEVSRVGRRGKVRVFVKEEKLNNGLDLLTNFLIREHIFQFE